MHGFRPWIPGRWPACPPEAHSSLILRHRCWTGRASRCSLQCAQVSSCSTAVKAWCQRIASATEPATSALQLSPRRATAVRPRPRPHTRTREKECTCRSIKQDCTQAPLGKPRAVRSLVSVSNFALSVADVSNYEQVYAVVLGHFRQLRITVLLSFLETEPMQVILERCRHLTCETSLIRDWPCNTTVDTQGSLLRPRGDMWDDSGSGRAYRSDGIRHSLELAPDEVWFQCGRHVMLLGVFNVKAAQAIAPVKIYHALDSLHGLLDHLRAI